MSKPISQKTGHNLDFLKENRSDKKGGAILKVKFGGCKKKNHVGNFDALN